MAYFEKIPMSRVPPSPSVGPESLVSDDYTLYSDAESIISDSASTDTFVSYQIYEELPPFQLPTASAYKKDVYEAWTVYLSADYKAPVSARKICGITVVEDLDSYQGMISAVSELYDQKDLMDMHFKALDEYQTKHKRAWPSRLVRGKALSYEDAIDFRMRKLPDPVQSEISNLLADREEASSNRFHNRAWTVVMMQEQLHRRFANANPTVVPKRHKVRFWKNPGKKERSEYFIIIRGAEGRPIADEKGQSEFKRFENPWRKADEAELRQKAQERRNKQREERFKAAVSASPPTYRYRGPPPASPPPAFAPRPRPYYPRPLGSMPPPPIGSYHPPQPPPPAARWTIPPPVPTPPASYPTPPHVRWAQGFSYCAQGPDYAASPPPMRLNAPYPPPGSVQQPHFPARGMFYPMSGHTPFVTQLPVTCHGPAGNVHQPYGQPYPPPPPPPPPPQTVRPFQPPYWSSQCGPPMPPPRPQPVVVEADAPCRSDTPLSVGSPSSKAKSVVSLDDDETRERGRHRVACVEDYDSDDDDATSVSADSVL